MVRQDRLLASPCPLFRFFFFLSFYCIFLVFILTPFPRFPWWWIQKYSRERNTFSFSDTHTLTRKIHTKDMHRSHNDELSTIFTEHIHITSAPLTPIPPHTHTPSPSHPTHKHSPHPHPPHPTKEKKISHNVPRKSTCLLRPTHRHMTLAIIRLRQPTAVTHSDNNWDHPFPPAMISAQSRLFSATIHQRSLVFVCWIYSLCRVCLLSAGSVV